jgi:dTMP kinase
MFDANFGVCADRTTAIGQMIDGYLKGGVDLDDHAIHLLFSANRWEAA